MKTRDIRFAIPKAPRVQLALYAQSLDEMVPEDAAVRAFAALLEEVDWSAWEKHYAGFGQPPIHPRYLAGAILFGLMCRLQSSRELERAARKHLDFIWLLEGFAPDHSTFANFRSDHAEAIGDLQRQIVRKLVGRRDTAVLELIVDGNFATGEVLAALDAQGIEAYMPTRSASPQANPALRSDPTAPVAEEDKARLPRSGGQFARMAFVYDAEADVYHCPAGQALAPCKQGKNKAGIACVYYQCSACPTCPWAGDCLKRKATHRTLVRDEYEPLREATDARMASEAGRAVYRNRAPGIEGVFARIKSCMGIRRFARRGLEKVRCDCNWTCTACNLKKLLAQKAGAAGGAPENRPEDPMPAHPRPSLRLLNAIAACYARIIRNHNALPAGQAPQRGRQTWKFGIA